MFTIFWAISSVLVVVIIFAADSLNELATLLVNDYFEAYNYYMDRDHTSGISVMSILFSMMLVYMFYYSAGFTRKELKAGDQLFIKYTSIFVLLNIVPEIGLISRFHFYFLFPTMIGVASILSYERNYVNKIIYIACWAIYCIKDMYYFSISSYVATTYRLYDSILF